MVTHQVASIHGSLGETTLWLDDAIDVRGTMRRLLDLRIIRWEHKFAFVAGVWLIGFPLSGLLSSLGLPPVIVAIVANSLVSIAGLLIGSRIFRGKGEPIEPPRPLWQMTARPTLSKRLGIAFAVWAILSCLTIVRAALEIAQAGGVDRLLLAIEIVLFTAVMSALYLNSASRLKRLGIGPYEPEFRPKAPAKLT